MSIVVPSYTELYEIAMELEPNANKNSDEFKRFVTYISMNWTRDYFRLRKILPFDKSLIEQCRQRFIYKYIRRGWLSEILILHEEKGQLYIQIEVALTVLFLEDQIRRVKL